VEADRRLAAAQSIAQMKGYRYLCAAQVAELPRRELLERVEAIPERGGSAHCLRRRVDLQGSADCTVHCPAGDCGAICREGTYYHRLACLVDPSKASARHQRDTELRPEIKRVWYENYQVYGVRKAWQHPLGITLCMTLPGNG
jgi:hypothetical protein